MFDCNCYHHLKEHMQRYDILSLNHHFDSLPNDEKWTFISALNDPYANYVLCSFVSKGL